MTKFGRFTRRSTRAVAAAAAAVLALMDVASAATCALADEKIALDTRTLQSELIVAALSCNEKARYGAFVKKFEQVLVANGDSLRQYFRRAYGAAGETHMNRLVTVLANGASARSMGQNNSVYCANEAALFTQVLALSPQELPVFVARLTFADDHGITPCTQQASREAGR
ncbi:MAG: hypothetical protein WCF16_01820 [Alphaproteobacteria bacterium]